MNVCRRNCQQFLQPGGISPQDHGIQWRNVECEFFESIGDDAKIWDSESVIKAGEFVVFLEYFKTLFLLQLLSDVSSYTDLLYSLLQTKAFDTLYWKPKLMIPFNMGSCCITERIRLNCVKRRRHSEEKCEVTCKRL